MSWSLERELREHRRVGLELPIRFGLTGSGGEPEKMVQALTSNISKQGLSFVTPVSIPIRTRLALELSLPGQPEDLCTAGTVVRIADELPNGEGFEYGVQFESVTPSESLERLVRAIDVYPLLELMLKGGASSLHLAASTPPALRKRHALEYVDTKPLRPDSVERLVLGVMSTRQRRELNQAKEIDFPLTIPELGRWRVNAHYQRGFLEAVFHLVNLEVPSIEELELPDVVRDLALSDGGLVLVTGLSGSGKRATLASMVGAINTSVQKVIISIEDPVRYVHTNKQSIVKQREVGEDAPSAIAALHSAFRQDPDVIAVDEIRDFEVADALLHAAEAGHLVLATFPSANVNEALDRLVTMYPSEHRTEVLHMLSVSLRGVVRQKLVVNREGQLTAAVAVMTMNEGIQNAIRTDKLDQIPNLMSRAPGAQPLDVSLRSLVLRGKIDADKALQVADNPEYLKKTLGEHVG